MMSRLHSGIRRPASAVVAFTLLATLLTAFVQQSGVAFAGDPSAVCPNRLMVTLNGKTAQFPYCSSKALEQANPGVKRAVIVVHGASRNADDYFSYLVNAAKTAGASNDSIILAPQFLEQNDIGNFNLPSSVPYWDGWREGDASENAPNISSYAIIDTMITKLANRSMFPNLQSIVVTGHSAGGQFTQRYAVGSRVEQQVASSGIQMRYVVANPSSYVYLDNKRRVTGSVNQFAVPTDKQRSDCPTYNTYKYGFDGLNPYMQSVGVDQLRAQYSRRDVVYLLGEKDTDPNNSSLDKDCPAMLQGMYRLERGIIYHNYVKQFYNGGASRHTKVTVPNVAHDGEAMYNSQQGIQTVFGALSAMPTNTPPAQPTGTVPSTTATPVQPTATSAPGNGMAVQSFTLINADTDKPIAGFDPLPNNATLNLARLPTRNLSIRVNTNPTKVGSVQFTLDDAMLRVENTAPYAIAGDNGGTDYLPWTPALGTHTLIATPYSGSKATGTAGTPLTVSYTVTNGGVATATAPATTATAPAATATPPSAITSRLLYLGNDATGQIEVYDIANGYKLLRSINVPGNKFNYPSGARYRGITAHAGTKRLYFTNAGDNAQGDNDPATQLIGAIDLTTEKVVWQFNSNDRGCKKPDRLNVTLDGSALYVPCKNSDKELILRASDGATIATLSIAGDPHNTFTGEQGKWMYMSARSSTVFHIADPKTHKIVKSISGMTSPVRPFSVTPSESYVFANLTQLMGFAVMDIRDPNPANWKKLMEITHPRPAQLPPHIDSPHGDNPQSHGIAVRPGGKEVWFIDDRYGFLYVYDITTLPNAPRHVATIPLFTDYSKPWTNLEQRWITFDATGKYAHAPNGWIIDADARKDTGMRVSPSEKMVEVDYANNVPVRVTGQNGGVYTLNPAQVPTPTTQPGATATPTTQPGATATPITQPSATVAPTSQPTATAMPATPTCEPSGGDDDDDGGSGGCGGGDDN
jgi:hypothetical protein